MNDLYIQADLIGADLFHHRNAEPKQAPLRQSGLDAVGAVPWGTHFCQFYTTSQDLVETLVPYFRAGLEANEFCMWVTAEPLHVEEAKAALGEVMPDLDDRLARGQIEILDYSQWYVSTGTFDTENVLQGWARKLDDALRRGFEGMRVTGNTFWLEEEIWQDFKRYEAYIDRMLAGLPVLVLCAYSLEKCGLKDILDVVANHEFALVKQAGRWELVSSVEHQTGLALRDSRERLARFAETTFEGIVICENGKIVDCNEQFARLLGYTVSELKGVAIPQLIAPEDRERVSEILQSGLDCHLENGLIRKDGSRIIVEARGKRSSYNPTQRYTTVRDITEQRQAKEALLEADRRKDEFLAMLSHELRNPLAPIRNAAHVLGRLELDEPLVKWAQKTIEGQVTHLTRLVDDLLDVSRIVRGKITLQKEEIELSVLVEKALEAVRHHMESKGQRLVVRLPEKPVLLEADPVRMTQVLLNLLDNAAKYNTDGGNGKIEFDARVEGQELIIRVSDNGVGISAELLPHVFELFMQDERTLDRAQGGLGIGLTLVQRLVEMHGGRAEAHSEGPGLGSTFILRLPIKMAPSSASANEQEEKNHLAHGMRVLVVDDDPAVADSTAVLLEIEGHEVRIAPSGYLALEQIPGFRPHAVILDIGLRGIDGFETARRIRQLPEGRDILLVAVTGYGNEETRTAALAVGFDHHLVKPVPSRHFISLLAGVGSRNIGD